VLDRNSVCAEILFKIINFGTLGAISCCQDAFVKLDKQPSRSLNTISGLATLVGNFVKMEKRRDVRNKNLLTVANSSRVRMQA